MLNIVFSKTFSTFRDNSRKICYNSSTKKRTNKVAKSEPETFQNLSKYAIPLVGKEVQHIKTLILKWILQIFICTLTRNILTRIKYTTWDHLVSNTAPVAFWKIVKGGLKLLIFPCNLVCNIVYNLRVVATAISRRAKYSTVFIALCSSMCPYTCRNSNSAYHLYLKRSQRTTMQWHCASNHFSHSLRRNAKGGHQFTLKFAYSLLTKIFAFHLKHCSCSRPKAIYNISAKII